MLRFKVVGGQGEGGLVVDSGAALLTINCISLTL